MKKALLTLALASGLALGGTSALQAHEHRGEGHGKRGGYKMMGGHSFKHLKKDLNLTAEQEAQVKPILEQAKPQMKAIQEEAMQKRKAVMDNTAAQIRPILTAEQQQKLDALQAAQEKMREARQEMRQARRDAKTQ
ncbi:hypothetical protein BH20VER2_BH20VER2_09940 [soil metagenome]